MYLRFRHSISNFEATEFIPSVRHSILRALLLDILYKMHSIITVNKSGGNSEWGDNMLVIKDPYITDKALAIDFLAVRGCP